MKKIFSRNTFKITLLLACVLPIAAMAQKEYYGRPSYWRPYDQRGINVFETSKTPDTMSYEGARVRFGAGFTQQYQNLKHENKTALDNTTTNRLYPLQSGFMTAQANLFMDIQLADGIRLNVTSYMSSRHHNETWVKGGYIQFDKLPLKGKFWTSLMEIATIKVGHMEINYGDAHFRRSDGGQTIYNAFMDNLIVDDFATEIGGEIYLQKNGLFGMVGITNGMIKGNVDSTYKTPVDDNIKRSPSIYLKGGIDKTIGDIARIRVSGSYYHNGSNAGSGLTLFSGDRTGSNYQNVMEKYATGTTKPAGDAIAFSGRLNAANFKGKVDAIMLNGFLKVMGLELFGTYETAKGRSKTEVLSRKFNQISGDVVYRFGKEENLFVGARYNTVKGQLTAATTDIKVDRTALAAGWFVTKNVLMKGEYVIQNYKNFATTDYRSGGKFKGFVIEAVVGF
ncbi:MAG: hypothetical protein ABIN67_14825 [Ferruginibacter sp.]